GLESRIGQAPGLRFEVCGGCPRRLHQQECTFEFASEPPLHVRVGMDIEPESGTGNASFGAGRPGRRHGVNYKGARRDGSKGELLARPSAVERTPGFEMNVA